MPVFDKFKALKTPDWADLVTGEGGALEVRLYGVIGETWYGDGTSARRLCDDIAAADPSEVTVRINSPGGSVTDGLTIYNYLRGLRAQGVPVITIIDGMAASIASVIALAGTQVRMNRAAFFHIHEPFSYVEGRAEEMRAAADDLDKVTATLAGVYAEKTGKPEAEIRELMRGKSGFDGTLMTSSEALVGGFVDEIDSEAVKLPAAAFSPDLFALTTDTLPGSEADAAAGLSALSPAAAEAEVPAPPKVAVGTECGASPAAPAAGTFGGTPENAPAEAAEASAEVIPAAPEAEPPAATPSDTSDTSDTSGQILTKTADASAEAQAEADLQELSDLAALRAELAAAKSQLSALQARVMGPATAPGPKYTTWREAVAALGYPEAKKQCPALYREAVSK